MTDEPSLPPCPFCRSNNLLKATVLAETDTAYLVDNIRFPDNYLILPNVHAESALELPDGWWKDVKSLLQKVPGLPESYNLSFNFGKAAGQTIRHMHLWVVPRSADKPSAGKGLVSLMNAYDERSS